MFWCADHQLNFCLDTFILRPVLSPVHLLLYYGRAVQVVSGCLSDTEAPRARHVRDAREP